MLSYFINLNVGNFTKKLSVVKTCALLIHCTQAKGIMGVFIFGLC